MQITPHFSTAEFTHSDTAVRFNIDNSIPEIYNNNVLSTCLLLEGIRTHLSKYAGRDVIIDVTSGYRCPEVNSKVGSKPASHHIIGSAADFKVPSFGTPYNVATILAPFVDALNIGQLIYEFDSWVHVSTIKPSKLNNRIITINKSGVYTGIIK